MKTTALKVSCPNCDGAELRTESSAETIRGRDGKKVVVDNYEHTVCSQCGFEFVSGTQAKANDQRIVDARRVLDGLLTSSEVLAIRKRFGLRQEDASEIFGGGRNAFSKYERGYVNQSTAMDKLLRVAHEFPEVVPFLAQIAGVELPPLQSAQPLFDAAAVTKKVDLIFECTLTSNLTSTETYIGSTSRPGRTRIANLEKVRGAKAKPKQQVYWVENPRVCYG